MQSWRIGVLFLTFCTTVATVNIDADFFPKFRKQIASQHYLETTGVIQESRIEYYYSSRPTRRRSIPVIRYTFSLEKRLYTCDRYKYAWGGRSVEEVIGRLPKGKTVPVHYNPENPGDAVLEKGVGEGDWLQYWLVVGLNFLVLFGWCIGLFWRRKTKAHSSVGAGGASRGIGNRIF